MSLSPFSQLLFSLEGQSHGDAGLYTNPSRAPATASRALEFQAREARAPFFPSLLCFLHHSFPPHTAFPGLAQKSPGSDLPWGGSGERVRLVNSAGVSRGWEGTLGTETQSSHTHSGDAERDPHNGSHRSFCVFSGCHSGPLPHPSCFSFSSEMAAISCALTMCQQLCLHLTFNLHKQLGSWKPRFREVKPPALDHTARGC